MKKIILAAAILAGLGNQATAQRYLGTSTSNWSGISSLYLNPANIADNRDKLVIDLFNFNVGVDNSLGKINANPGISRFINGGENNINDVFNFSNKSKFSLLAPYVEVRGPGIMAKICHNQSLALTTRVRGFNQLNNFDQSLYRTITDSAYARSGNLDLVAQNFNWTAHLWAEAALTYGAVVLDKGHSELKVGGTVRYLSGIGFLGLKGKNLDLHYSTGADSFYAKNTDLQYASNIYSATNALTNGVSASNLFDNFFNGKGGSGVGGDIGIVYEYLEDTTNIRYDMDGKTGIRDGSKNRYKFRLSASVTDLGFITYPSNNNFAVNVTGNGYITGKGFSANVKDFNDFTNYTAKQGFHADTAKASNRVYMPTTLILSADYHAWKNFYVNASYFNNLVYNNSFGNSYYNQLSITPRYDKRMYSIGLPITYSWLTQSMKMGIGLRYSGFYIGSDDLLAAFSHSQYGLNLYVGGYVPFGNKKPKDRDGDHVSNRRDRCPDEYGEWEHHGCPIDKDTEKEKEDSKEKADTTDNCPETSGLVLPLTDTQFKDTDGDGIPDNEDACPMVAGPAETHGCPVKEKIMAQQPDLKTYIIGWHGGNNPITENDFKTLDRFGKMLNEYPDENILIESYTSKLGDAKKCKAIAKQRAEIVKSYFTNKGFNEKRIVVLPLGSQKSNFGHAITNCLEMKLVKNTAKNGYY